jgi:molecular chaperone HtpG
LKLAAFQAEVKQLLHLVTHSLYSNKEIFLRELISNASDACDKLRFEALNNPRCTRTRPTSKSASPSTRTRPHDHHRRQRHRHVAQEVIDNLGTIAKSGTREFMSALSGDQKKDAQLIGQFGVGFYSASSSPTRSRSSRAAPALPAERRRALESAAAPATSRSRPSTRAERGTERHPAPARGEDEFLSLEAQVDHPQVLRPHLAADPDAEGGVGGRRQEAGHEGRMGDRSTRRARCGRGRRSDITEGAVRGVLQAVSHDFEAPLAYTHNRVEGRSEYTQLLYIPARAPFDLWNRDKRGGVKLYVKRVFIMDDAEALLPAYLRFVKGVIDSADLPLNVSREMLQESRDVKAIREGSHQARAVDARRPGRSGEGRTRPRRQGQVRAFWTEFGAC